MCPQALPLTVRTVPLQWLLRRVSQVCWPTMKALWDATVTTVTFQVRSCSFWTTRDEPWSQSTESRKINNITVFAVLACMKIVELKWIVFSKLFLFWNLLFSSQVSGGRENCDCNQCVLSPRWPWETREKTVQTAVLQVAPVSCRSFTKHWQVGLYGV